MIRLAGIIAFPLCIGTASAAAGSKSLFAVALGFMIVVVLLGAALVVGARRVVVDRAIDRHEVVEDEPIALRFTVGRLGWLPVRAEVRDADGHWRAAEPDGVAIGADEPHVVAVDRPGAHMLGPSPMRLRDDLGLLTKRFDGGAPQALLILPVPEPPHALADAGGAQHLGDVEPDGLRPYVPGTPMSRIHWPSAARGAELQERHFVTARDRLPLVVVDLSGEPSPEAVDWAARTASGYALALARRGGCRVALPGDRTPSVLNDPTIEWAALHRRLAALDDLAQAGAAPFHPGEGDRDAIWVRAAAAPEEELHERDALPPGVVPLHAWTEDAA